MNDTQNRPDSMIIGNCLNCQGLVRVPSTAPAQSRVRCPHCNESYMLSQILDQAVPELEVMSDPEAAPNVRYVDQVTVTGEDSDVGEPSKFVVPKQLSDGASRSKRRKRTKSDSGIKIKTSSDESVGDSLKSLDWQRSGGKGSSAKGKSSQTRRSRTQTSQNGFIELLKVVLGGVLAIPIAYLLVFWVFQKDPLEIGPGISQVAPFLVPEDFRGIDLTTEETLLETNRK